MEFLSFLLKSFVCGTGRINFLKVTRSIVPSLALIDCFRASLLMQTAYPAVTHIKFTKFISSVIASTMINERENSSFVLKNETPGS